MDKSCLYLYILCILIINICGHKTSKENGQTKRVTNNIAVNEEVHMIPCSICKIAVEFVETLLQQNISESEFEKASTKFCIVFDLANSEVCAGMIAEMAPTIIPIYENVVASPLEICTKLSICTSNDNNDTRSFIPKPRIQKLLESHRTFSSSFSFEIELPIIKAEEGTGYFLQLTDIHVDPLYQEGSTTDCGYPLCCRSQYPDGKILAGKWGDYHCDIPFVTLDSMFQTLKTLSIQPDFILYTGDSPPHDVWSQSKESVLNNIFNVSKMLTETYPSVPVFPVIGNHDTFPVDQYSSKNVDISHHDDFSWIREGVAEAWGSWLPLSAISTLRSDSYYSVLVSPGLRVVSINSQWADRNNFYLLLKEDQTLNQTNWLIETLNYSRLNKEKVYLIAHISVGSATSSSYYASDLAGIVVEFSDVIAAQFYGHTHEDEFEVTIDPKGNPVGVSYISPSVTTFWGRNPTFRFYKYNTSTHEILDYFQYYMNITQANIDNSPKWELEYSAKDEYSLTDLSPSSWLDLVNRFKDDNELWNQYWDNYNSQAPHPLCEGSCKQSYICGSFGVANPIQCSNTTISVLPINQSN